jgi:hypothetical protein
MPTGRMLKKEITPSDKINSISFPSALLFTWVVSFEDSAGYIEAEPRWLKHTIYPARDILSVDDLAVLAIEIIMSGAWIPFRSKENGKRYVWDPKFEEKQKARPKYVEADSPFATRVMRPNKQGNLVPCEIKEQHIGLERIPLEEVERTWGVVNYRQRLIEIHERILQRLIDFLQDPMPSHSGGIPLPATPPDSPRRLPPKPPPEKSKALTVKKILEDDPEMNELVHTLRGDKFPQVGSFLGKCLKEIKGVQVGDLKQTLRAIAEKDKFEGEIFPYAIKTLKSIVNDNVTRRVEEQSQKFKKEEAKGPEQLGKILGGLQDGRKES